MVDVLCGPPCPITTTRPRPRDPPAQQSGKASASGIFNVGSRDHIFATVLGRVFYDVLRLFLKWVGFEGSIMSIDNFCTDFISFPLSFILYSTPHLNLVWNSF